MFSMEEIFSFEKILPFYLKCVKIFPVLIQLTSSSKFSERFCMETSLKHQPGQVVHNFKLSSHLGNGGFGEVWMAEHIELPGKKEVLKFVHDKKSLEILRDEGVVMHELNHPGIVRVTDMDTSSQDPHLRMEYIEGITLEQLLQKNNKIPWPQALEICWQIADILQFAHEQHIYHGDIKPSNIFLCKEGVKLTDFGLGTYYLRNKDSLEFSGCLKGADIKAVGTWDYMSPEQKQGKINSKTDIYSLGVILYRLITGNLPSGLEVPSNFIPDCSKELDILVSKMLAPTEKRCRNMENIKNDIHKILEIYKKKPSLIWEMFCFILGILLIVFATGFLNKIPIALCTVTIIGLIFLETARAKIPQFWSLLFFWIGIGFSVVGLVNRLYILVPIPFVIGIIGGVWFLLTPDPNEEKKQNIPHNSNK